MNTERCTKVTGPEAFSRLTDLDPRAVESVRQWGANGRSLAGSTLAARLGTRHPHHGVRLYTSTQVL